MLSKMRIVILLLFIGIVHGRRKNALGKSGASSEEGLTGTGLNWDEEKDPFFEELQQDLKDFEEMFPQDSTEDWSSGDWDPTPKPSKREKARAKGSKNRSNKETKPKKVSKPRKERPVVIRIVRRRRRRRFGFL